MRDGFIKVAAGTPQIRVADCRYNAEQIFTLMREADKQGVRVLALPELCLTGYTCGDLFLQDTLLRGAEEGLATILEATKHLDLLAAVGLPVRHQNKLYNCAAVLHRGEILALVPKTYLPNYGEFYEKRWFEPAGPGDRLFSFCGQEVYLGGTTQLLKFPEYRDADKARDLMTFMVDNKQNLPVPSGNAPVQILIGPENVDAALKESSVVIASYDIGDGMRGLVGVVGPTRMDYASVAARLTCFAESLSHMFEKRQLPPTKEEQS